MGVQSKHKDKLSSATNFRAGCKGRTRSAQCMLARDMHHVGVHGGLVQRRWLCGLACDGLARMHALCGLCCERVSMWCSGVAETAGSTHSAGIPGWLFFRCYCSERTNPLSMYCSRRMRAFGLPWQTSTAEALGRHLLLPHVLQ